MKKSIDFNPIINIIEFNSSQGSQMMEFFVDTPTGCLTRKPLLIRLPTKFQQIELIVEGFEFFEKDSEGTEFITGDVFLITNGEQSGRILIASPQVIVNTKNTTRQKRKKSSTQIVRFLRKEIVDSWQNAFLLALDDYNSSISNDSTLNRNNSNPQSNPKGMNLNKFFPNIDGYFGNFIKLSICFLLIGFIGYMGLNIYGKAMQVQNTRSTNISLNPTALAQNQKDVVDETFKEMGIDRSKLTSDLSCFAE